MSSTARAPGAMVMVGVALLALVSGCAGPAGDAEPSETPRVDLSTEPSEDPAPTTRDDVAPTPGESDPQATNVGPVPITQWRRMIDAGMVRPECPVQRREELRRVDVDFLDFRGRNRRGHLVVRDDTARSVARIFTELRDQEFPIRRMVGVERFGGDLDASLRANNTSAFNCRRADQINAPFAESPHANGRAVDINPVQNPWMDLRCDCWSPGPRFAARTAGPGKILEGDAVWSAFVDEGWIWQNISVADYMHFDTGYPSTPYAG